MKKLLVLTAILLHCFGLLAQSTDTIEVKTSISSATVYFTNAQVTRKGSVMIPSGKSLLKFSHLSPYLKESTIQVKIDSDIKVLSVYHLKEFEYNRPPERELNQLKARLRTVEQKIDKNNLRLNILNEELDFLQANKVIGGKNQVVTVQTLREATAFYSGKVKSILESRSEIHRTLKLLNREKGMLNHQIRMAQGVDKTQTGSIYIAIESPKNTTSEITLSYLTGNTGWLPAYSISVNDIDSPMRLCYKANVRQNTKEDWNNIQLRFSNSAPNTSGIIPALKPYRLGFNTLPPKYENRITRVTGRVFDSNNHPLSGCRIVIEGTTIGTLTNADGWYSLNIPNNARMLRFSQTGYKPLKRLITGERIDINMQAEQTSPQPVSAGMVEIVEDEIEIADLEEAVELADYNPAPKRNKARIKSFAGVVSRQNIEERPSYVDFSVDKPYTITSGNRPFTVDLICYEIPATYRYYAVPKIESGAYLTAEFDEWEALNLLEATATIFYENTMLGSTVLDPGDAGDTLKLTLGIDKGVSVKRTLKRTYTRKHLIGNSKEESRTWEITVRNNKSKPINIIVTDQIPVSTSKEIEVEITEQSGAHIDPESGEVKWDLQIPSHGEKVVTLSYTVKHPKNKKVIVE